jgi:hypothetical protein
MQDPDRRGRRARCAALIQGCRVHEWSWNAPSLFSKHQRAVTPRRSQAASCPEGRSVGAPCERSSRSSTWLHLLAFVGAAWRTSLPFFTTIRAMQRGPTTKTSAATTIQINAFCGSSGGGRGASLMALPGASWLRWSNLKSRNEAQGPKGAEGPYDRCWDQLPRRCCARATSSRLIRSSASLCS